ncbi:MAG: right-handed parallel beta-helix repeat-containing protein [Nanoarchaeota archaeon]|nr:right-handed parallel beta-helix repeat-containing protein [Nanoarchaeota archaeon]
MIRITLVSNCSIPYNNMLVTEDTILCAGVYNLNDFDYDESLDKVGIIRINGNGITFDCNGSTLNGGGAIGQGSQKGAGFAITVDSSENVVIKNCNIGYYEFAIAANRSRNLTIYNNSIYYNDVGIGFGRTNESWVFNNTVKQIGTSAYALTDMSYNNIFENNLAVNNFVSFIVDNSHYNTLRANNISSTELSLSYIAGIALFGGSTYNHIDDNTVNNLLLGVGMADVGRFLTQESSGFGGMWNNFSRNIINDSLVASIGLLLPYPPDYFNYFEQSNLINGEPIYYYVNQHGTPSSPKDISGLSLDYPGSSIFMGKVTLVNCSHFTVSDNTLANNFYDLLLVNSSNITVSGNIIENATDANLISVYDTFGVFAGVGVQVISSKDIALLSNNISGNLFGVTSLNMTKRLNISNSIIRDNSVNGMALSEINDSYITNNNITSNSEYGVRLYNDGNIFLDSNDISFNNLGVLFNLSSGGMTYNTIHDNTLDGVSLFDCLNPISFYGNNITGNLQNGLYVESCSGTTLSNVLSTGNSDAGIYLKDSDNLLITFAQSNESSDGIIFDNTNNTQVFDSLFVNNTASQIYFENSVNNSIIHSVLINNLTGGDIESSNSYSNTFLNTSFNRSNTIYNDADSNLSMQWHLDFYVQDNESYIIGQSIPISGVNIFVRDTDGGNQQVIYTDSYGKAYFNVSEYLESDSGRTYFSNYSWNLTKLGHEFSDGMITSYFTSTNLTENRYFNLSMALKGGISDTTPPTNPIVVDGPDYVDIDWFSNRTTLSASWYNSTDQHLIFYSYIIFENGTCFSGYCSESSVYLNTSVTVPGLSLTEGMNYTFAIRARDSLFWYTPFAYSDGAVADFTAPESFVSSPTHPNESVWYNDGDVTLNFNATDSLSGVAGLSYLLDQNPGTGPDLIAEERPTETIHLPANTGYGSVLKSNSTGEAFAVFSEVEGNLSQGDNITVTVQLSEDISDTLDSMNVRIFLLSKAQTASYGEYLNSFSTVAIIGEDIHSKPYSSADTYSASLTVLQDVENSFYVVVEGLGSDDDNTHNLSIAGADSGVDNSTETFVCGELSACTNVTNSADYAIGVKKQSSQASWSKSYSGLGAGIHYFHVRALDLAGNWGNPAHYRIQIDAEEGAPVFTNIKPRGYIITTTPTLVVETNEYAICYYNTSGSDNQLMTSYDGLYHESLLSLSQGNYTYDLNCTDRSGNSGYNSTTFLIDPSATPDSIIIGELTNYTAGQKVRAIVNVTKEYDGISYGLGELSLAFSVNMTNSTNTYGIPIEVYDRGDGVYFVDFFAPKVAGSYILTVGVGSVTDNEVFTVNSYSLTITYSGITTIASASDRMVFGRSENDYSVGLALETPATYLVGTTSELSLKYTAVDGKAFIFITDPYGDINRAGKYLNKGTFQDLKNPSFGHDLFEEQHVLSTILDYSTIHLLGADKVYEGRYSILIRNDGVNVSSGKTKITIEII